MRESAYSAAAERTSFLLPGNSRVSVNVSSSPLRVRNDHAKHCVPAGGPPSGAASARPVLDTATSAQQPSWRSAPSAISRATSSLDTPDRSIVFLLTPRKPALPEGEELTKPTSRHAPLPGALARLEAIWPPVQDSAVASFRPRD